MHARFVVLSVALTSPPAFLDARIEPAPPNATAIPKPFDF
jgi:hypothetical protein